MKLLDYFFPKKGVLRIESILHSDGRVEYKTFRAFLASLRYPRDGAIVLDTAGSGGTSDQKSYTLSYTVGASSNLLVVMVSTINPTTSGVKPTATYNSVSMTEDAYDSYTTSGYNPHASIFTLVNPATGTHNVVVSASDWCGFLVTAVSMSGANSSPAGATATFGGTGTSTTTNITATANGSILFDCLCAGTGTSCVSTTTTADAGQTELTASAGCFYSFTNASCGAYAAASYKSVNAGATTMGQTVGSGTRYNAYAILEIKQSTASPRKIRGHGITR